MANEHAFHTAHNSTLEGTHVGPQFHSDVSSYDLAYQCAVKQPNIYPKQRSHVDADSCADTSQLRQWQQLRRRTRRCLFERWSRLYLWL